MRPHYPGWPQREAQCCRKMNTCNGTKYGTGLSGDKGRPAICRHELRTYNLQVMMLVVLVVMLLVVLLAVLSLVLLLLMLTTQAECGGPEDWYHFSPWRAPGAAPVFDSCGVAGGTGYWGRSNFGAQYFNTTDPEGRGSFDGAYGSKTLKPTAAQATWKRGSTVEVLMLLLCCCRSCFCRCCWC